MVSCDNDKVDVVFAMLACGSSVYRRWWWVNYKSHGSQQLLRAEWIKVLGRFEKHEVRDGMFRWANLYGVDTPPTPIAFADFIKPVLSDSGRRRLEEIKRRLA